MKPIDIIAASAAVAACLAGIAGAGPAIQATAQESEDTATSIYDSNVWWDLYKLFKDRYLAENPTRTDFNPYYLTPAYGYCHGQHDDARLLCAYPYGNDLFLYTWLDTSSVSVADWAGGTIKINYTNNTNVSADGSGFADEGTWKTDTATLVNADNYSPAARSNWLGKWLLKGVNAVTDPEATYRVKVNSMWLYGPGIMRWDCGDDIQYKKTDAFKDLNYYYVQPDYIRITRKKAALWLSPETGPNGALPLIKWDPSCYPGGSLSANCYQKMKERTYCFFNAGETSLDGSFQEADVSKLESVTYSYVKTSYTHHSSQIVETGHQAYDDDRETRVFQGLLDDSWLNQDAYFSDISSQASGELTVSSDYVSSSRVQTGSFLGWSWWYDYKALGIVDCRGDTDIPSGSEYDSLRKFITDRRSFDSDGDGADDKQFAWAFLADEDERSSSIENYGTAVVTSWFKNVSRCHQIDDIVVLRLKFCDSDGKLFDLDAMDVNTPTTEVETIGGGKDYIVAPEWWTKALGFLDQYKGILIAIAALVGIGLLIALSIYIMPILRPLFALAEAPFKAIGRTLKKKKGDGGDE